MERIAARVLHKSNQLQNGTCISCTCLVAIRAAQKAKRCPDGKWSV
ncbi:MAG: hypothetical protein IKR85_08390 [Clostridia bacterium]|nr:hypothetical protein [Clostridia bacterium]